jgi:O-antigen ligase
MYGTLCYLIGHNPYIDFIQSTNHTDRILAQTYEDTLRGARAQGTLSHPITYGALLAITLLTYYTVKLNKVKFALLDYAKVTFITTIIVTGILFTNSRSPLILFLVPVITFATTLRFVKAFKSIIGITLIFVIAFSASEVVRDKTYSIVNIFNPEVGEDMKGSDLAMRGGQLSVATRYFFESPIWGMGLDATRNIISSGKEPDLYNSESIIFRLLIDQGSLGIISYALFFIVAYRKTSQHMANIASRRMYLGTMIGYIIFIISTGFVDTLQNTVFMLCITYYIFKADRVATRSSQTLENKPNNNSSEKLLNPVLVYPNSAS